MARTDCSALVEDGFRLLHVIVAVLIGVSSVLVMQFMGLLVPKTSDSDVAGGYQWSGLLQDLSTVYSCILGIVVCHLVTINVLPAEEEEQGAALNLRSFLTRAGDCLFIFG